MLERKKLFASLAMVLAVPVTVVLLGGSGEPTASGKSRAADALAVPHGPLDGQRYASFSVRGKELIAGTRVRLAFFDGGISFTTGCNLGQGRYQLVRGELLVQRTLSTMVGCSDEREAQDQWLDNFIQETHYSNPGGNQLRISDGGVTIELERQP